MMNVLIGMIAGMLASVSLALGTEALAESKNTGLSATAEQEKDMLFLLVDKSNLRADLKTWPENPERSELLASFRIAIGKEEGDKQVEGDNKTPEGIYFAQEIIDGNTLPAKYGPFAIPIDFPNPLDRSWGKTGYGIWLHGVERDARVEEAKVTEGCVAFYNADIDSLTKWLKPQHSVIIISKEQSVVNKSEDLAIVNAATQSWLKAWQIRDLDAYIAAYAPSFRYRNMGLDRFKSYKQRVFNSYKNMNVNMSQIRVFTHDRYAISIMNQDFNGDDRYVSKGRKVLYWTRQDNGSWRISHEAFGSSRFEMQPFSRDFIAKLARESPSSRLFSNETKDASNL
jgi:murein L,D-transpeptidase YafK